MQPSKGSTRPTPYLVQGSLNIGKQAKTTPKITPSNLFRYYGSQDDYKKDSEAKYDNSRRYRDPISINDRSLKSYHYTSIYVKI